MSSILDSLLERIHGVDVPNDALREDYLRMQRDRMDRRFFLIRVVFALGLAGYAGVQSYLTTTGTPGLLMALVSYALLNAGIWLTISNAFPRAGRWASAALDVGALVLVRHAFAIETLVDPNVAMAGAFAIMLVAYTVYLNPRFTAILAMSSMVAMGATLWYDAYVTFAVTPDTSWVNEHSLRAILVMSYLAAFCLLATALTLFMRQQALDYFDELGTNFGRAVQASAERAQRQRLTDLNRMKENFIGTLAHELRTPLTPLLSALELLEMETESCPEARDVVGIATTAAQRMNRLVQDYVQLADLLTTEVSDEERRTLSVSRLLEELSERHDDQRVVVLDTPHVPDTTADPRLLHGALVALLRRGLLRSQSMGKPVLLRAVPFGDRSCIEVRDAAPYAGGLEEGPEDDLFVPCGERVYSSENTGLELVLARHAMRRVGGHLQVEECEQGGTVVRLLLPPADRRTPETNDEALLASLGVLA